MKKYLLIILLTLSIILAGCGTGSTKTPSVGFIGGVNGLVPTLNVISSQANQILDNGAEPFQLTVKLQNKGEYTINENEILTSLSGIDLGAYQIQEPNGVSINTDVLEKARLDNGKLLPTSETVISYDANYKFKEPTDKTQDVGIDVCYKYETIASADACLRKDVTKAPTGAKCKVDEQKVVGNSGAPVQVTLLSQRPADKNMLRFTINIENKGKGEVYSPDFLSKGKCIDDAESKNKLNVKVGFPDNLPKVICARLNNGNQGSVPMIQGRSTLTCTADTTSVQDSTFTKSLITTVDYVYKDGVSGKLTIRSSSS